MQGSLEGNWKLKALKISTIAIFSVVFVEVTLGFFVNSLAIISDGLHALLDAVSGTMLFFAVRTSLKPPDAEHTYGHEKFEAIGGLVGGIALIAVAFLVFYEAANRLITNTQIAGNVEYVGFIAISYSLLIASLRVTVFRKSQHIQSPSMKAGLYDAISDLSSTLIALLGFGLAIFGYAGADSVASIFLGILLSYLSTRLVRFSVIELSDTASKELVAKALKTITSCDGVVKADNLKVRKVSSKIFIEASVQVPNLLSLEEAHLVSSKIENCLKDTLGNVDATIHVEPSDREKQLQLIVKRLASIEGVKEIHEISTNYVGSKLYITLHAYVDPVLSVDEAHTIAEKIEWRIRAKIKDIENITVHVEPAGVTLAGGEINDVQLTRIVETIAKNIADNLHIKKVVTYAAGSKRYINIDCCFTRQVQIIKAHKIASQIEKETKEKFVSSIVTVHIEPE